jgi:hypothetical protein
VLDARSRKPRGAEAHNLICMYSGRQKGKTVMRRKQKHEPGLRDAYTHTERERERRHGQSKWSASRADPAATRIINRKPQKPAQRPALLETHPRPQYCVPDCLSRESGRAGERERDSTDAHHSHPPPRPQICFTPNGTQERESPSPLSANIHSQYAPTPFAVFLQQTEGPRLGGEWWAHTNEHRILRALLGVTLPPRGCQLEDQDLLRKLGLGCVPV